MKRLLNTLYITTPNAYISKEGTNIVISVDNEERFRIPSMNLQAINTFGYQGASPGVMKLCADNGIALTFFSPNGRFIARCQGPTQGNILLRIKQYRILDDAEARVRISRLFIYGKLFNTRAILRRCIRDYPAHTQKCLIEKSAERIRMLAIRTLAQTDLDQLRGLEGEGASEYFSVFDHLILHQKREFRFEGRVRRPPTDYINAMLSFAYSMLANDCAAALEGVGLDPAAGFMHALRPGRNSLALDLMEEMRGYIVDRFVLSLINTRQITPSDFKRHTSIDSEMDTSVTLTESGMKKFLTAWQARKKTEFQHPFINEKISIGLLPHVQALLLARFIRGDIDNYPVFLMK
ncbi:MAG: type I-C CRISPR-associated endonuclease Cas1 [Bacteroides sp.]|nr:type I-C CRISPR-associated endonuclease Cas1 [Bacteroides sp.]